MAVSESQRPKNYVCDIESCKKAFNRPCLLTQHKRTHTNERPFKCEECGKSFFRQSHLKCHKWSHSDIKPLTCVVCTKGFTTNQQLNRHLKTHEPSFKCPYESGVKFLTKEDLKTHILQEHIASETISAIDHVIKIQKDLETATDPHRQLKEWSFDDWSDYHCKEAFCQGYPNHSSYPGLLLHYEQYHEFIPEGLLQQDLSQKLEDWISMGVHDTLS